MNSGPGDNIIILDFLVVCQLLAGVNQTNLVDLDAFFFLELLFDQTDLVGQFDVHRLLSTGQRLDQDLRSVSRLGERKIAGGPD